MFIVLSHHGNTNHNYFVSLHLSSQNGYYDKRAHAGEDMKMTEPYVLLVKMQVVHLHGNQYGEFSKLELPHDDIVMLYLGMYVQNSKSTCHSDSCHLRYKNIYKVKLCDQPKGLETDEWTKKGYIYTYTLKVLFCHNE